MPPQVARRWRARGAGGNPPFSAMDWVLLTFLPSNYKLLLSSLRGTSALHLNEATWIIDGSNELIVDFLFALVLFYTASGPSKI